MPVIHWSGDVVVLAGFSSLAALEVVKKTTFSVAGGGGLVGVAAFPASVSVDMYYDNVLSRTNWCMLLQWTSVLDTFDIPYVFNFNVYVFYILVSLESVLLRPTTSLLWLILSLPMCIDVTMCMLMLLFYDSCVMLALYVSIKFLLTNNLIDYKHTYLIWKPNSNNNAHNRLSYNYWSFSEIWSNEMNIFNTLIRRIQMSKLYLQHDCVIKSMA